MKNINIVISAVSKPKLITLNMVRKRVVIIDVDIIYGKINL